MKEFRNEIQTLSRIEHLNLVRLYGYLEQGDERIIIVEYVANGNLREHLDGKQSWRIILNDDIFLTYALNSERAYCYVKGDSVKKVISLLQASEESTLRLESVWTLPLMLLMLSPTFTCTMVCTRFS